MESNIKPTVNPAAQQPAPRRSGAPVVGGVVLAAVLIGLGVAPRLHQHAELSQSVAEAQTDTKAPLVEFVALDAPATPAPGAVASATGDNPADLVLPASIQAIEETTIGARTTGYVRNRYVDIGSRVKAGDVLADIESPEVDQQLTQAIAQNAKSQAGTGQAEAQVAGLKAGVAQSNANLQKSIAALDQAIAARSKAKAQVAQAQANVANARAAEVKAEKVLSGKQALVAQVQAQLDLDQKSYERWVSLGKEGAVAQQDVDTRISAYNAGVATLNSAKADVESAQADVDAAKQQIEANLSAKQAALQDVASSEQSINAAKSQIASDRAGVVSAQAGVAAGQQNVQAAQAQVGADSANIQHYAVLRSFEKVIAPFAGVITQRDVDKGALITAGGAGTSANLFNIARTDMLRIVVSVPQTSVASIHAGQKVTVTLRELPGRKFEGEVYRTSGALDPGTRTMVTEVHVPNPTGTLLPGMYAQVRFPSQGTIGVAGHKVVRIPSDTLLSDASGTRVVAITNDGKAHYVPITIGRDFGTQLEVTEGLQGNEHLIENPSDDLTEGQTVRGVPATALTVPGAPGAAPAKK